MRTGREGAPLEADNGNLVVSGLPFSHCQHYASGLLTGRKRKDQMSSLQDWSFHPSVHQVMQQLRAWGVQVLACGQTVFWDEPTKAAVCIALHALVPEIRMVMGVHDADYFSKLPRVARTGRDFGLAPHNDRSTRGMWAAAGEISRLFGSETVPTVRRLTALGASLRAAAKRAEEGQEDFCDRVTEAWGWRGLVYTGAGHPVACDVPVRKVLAALKELVCWGILGSGRLIEDGDQVAEQLHDRVIGWLEEFAAQHADAALPQLYEYLFPRFYDLCAPGLLAPDSVFTATDCFRFNRATASLPRFSLVNHFLNPETRRICERAYDNAVAGAGIYPLHRFGPGALPFDLVIPGKGRGTLFTLDGVLAVDLAEGILTIPHTGKVEDVHRLADVVESSLGPNTSLVGKAVALLPMLCSERVMVLHEMGSPYVEHTVEMVEEMEAGGVEARFFPILRVRLHTWDALSQVEAEFNLPDHLAQAFGRGQVKAQEFAAGWCEAVQRVRSSAETLRRLRSPRAGMEHLAAGSKEWAGRWERYCHLRRQLAEIGARIERLRAQMQAHADHVARHREEIARLEAEHGRLRRPRLVACQPAGSARMDFSGWTEEETGELERRIIEKRAHIRAARSEREKVKRAAESLAKGPEASTLRDELCRLEAQLARARAEVARDAVLCEGLLLANYRPSAWWFPLVDPSGGWFRRLTETMEMRFEPMGKSLPAPPPSI